MWTPATRVQHTRVSNRYQTDLTDAEWLLIAERTSGFDVQVGGHEGRPLGQCS
jgi:hypothetical protein